MMPATDPLQRGWVRSGALLAAFGVHIAAVLLVTIPKPNLPVSVDSLEITIAQGAPVVEQPPEPPPEPVPEPVVEPPPAPTPPPPSKRHWWSRYKPCSAPPAFPPPSTLSP